MERIKRAFDKYKFKTLKKAYAYFDAKGLDIPHKEIKEYFDSVHSHVFLKKFNKAEMGSFFSTTPGAYQMDIWFWKKRPYLLCVDINSRYAWIEALKSKNTKDILPALKKFVYECFPSSISSDEESAFRSIPVVDYLRAENVQLYISLGQLHTDLAIINRLCRTLNSMMEEHSDPIEAVKIYNKTPHSSTGVSPKEMHNDEHLEIEYIYEMMKRRDEKKKLLLENPIEKGDNVRYVLDKQIFKKNQHNRKLSKHYYKVEDVLSPFTFVIIAKDGSVKQLPRYRLYKISSTKGLEFGETIEDESYFTVYDKIFQYFEHSNPRKAEYEVQIINRDKDGVKHKSKRRIRASSLREGNPTYPSALEREFFADKLDKFRFNRESGMFESI